MRDKIVRIQLYGIAFKALRKDSVKDFFEYADVRDMINSVVRRHLTERDMIKDRLHRHMMGLEEDNGEG